MKGSRAFTFVLLKVDFLLSGAAPALELTLYSWDLFEVARDRERERAHISVVLVCSICLYSVVCIC